LEGDQLSEKSLSQELQQSVSLWQQRINKSLLEDADIVIADSRYGFIHEICQHVLSHKDEMRKTLSSRIDRIVLNRYLGIPIFLAVMYCLFVFSINIGGAFQDFFALSSKALFVDAVDVLLDKWQAPLWLHGIISHGVGVGIHTTITFIPVLCAMFFMLSILESSGYMARAAFVMDRLLRVLGLPGKAFLPLIVGFGCNVPAIMSARTLDSGRERIITILMAPFMSCSARLAVYAVFVSAFFPVGGQNVIFSLYLIGVVCAVLTGLAMRHTLLRGQPSPLLLELPAYHAPNVRNVLFSTYQRLQGFLWRAGKVIIPVCMLLGVAQLLTLPMQADGSSVSILVWLGKSLTPIFTPMGISSENWPATVALLTGTLAKEVLIGTLNTLYAQAAHIANGAPEHFHLLASLKQALLTIPDNLKALLSSFWNPIVASAPQQSINQGVYGEFVRRFATASAAYSYLLFVLLYIPCVSTYAVTVRELSRGWAVFSLLWSMMLAYTLAVISYQVATWSLHPMSSFLWCISLLAGVVLVFSYLRYYSSSSKILNSLREVAA